MFGIEPRFLWLGRPDTNAGWIRIDIDLGNLYPGRRAVMSNPPTTGKVSLALFPHAQTSKF
jgi:hypothetical protein